MDSCIFCKIVKGEIPCFKIYEDEKFLAILDISQFVQGHTILIPKEHFKYVWDIPYIDEYYKIAQKIVDHFRKDLGFEYVDSATFGRLVPHAHLHLLPHNGDGNDWSRSLEKVGEMQNDTGRRPSKELGEEIVKRFKL